MSRRPLLSRTLLSLSLSTSTSAALLGGCAAD